MRRRSWICAVVVMLHAPGLALAQAIAPSASRPLPPAWSLGARIDQPDANGKTRLMFAIMNRHLARADELLEAGASPDATDLNGRTPLMMAAKAGDHRLVRAMLAAGAQPDAQNAFGCTALTIAAENGRPKTVRELLAAGADPEISCWDTGTALMWAAAAGHARTVLALLQGGAQPNTKAEGGRTALISAAAGGHVGALRVLLAHGADPGASASSEGTALHSACWAPGNQVTDIFRELIGARAPLEARDWQGETPLLCAMSSGHRDAVPVFVNAGANVNAMDDAGNTPLLHAVMAGNEPLVAALLEAGANPNGGGPNLSALAAAAQSAQPRLVSRLLRAGAEPNWRSADSRWTPIVFALDTEMDCAPTGTCDPVETVRVLTRAGADLSLKTAYGRTPLEFAEHRAGQLERNLRTQVRDVWLRRVHSEVLAMVAVLRAERDRPRIPAAPAAPRVRILGVRAASTMQVE